MNVDSEELRSLVGSTIESIEQGMQGKNYHLSGCIEFEVAVVNMENAQGGIKLFVVGLSGKVDTQCVSKIKFKVEKDRPRTNVNVRVG